MTPISIEKIGIEKNTPNANSKNSSFNRPSFTGGLDAAVSVLKTFNDKPMIGVAFTDTVATNAPRSLGDLVALGPAAGAETARREFSGLIVNCLLPSFFVLGAAKLINHHYMKDFGVNMSSSWANSETIDTLKNIYKTAMTEGGGDTKKQAERFVKNTIENLEGLDGKKWVDYSDKLNSKDGKKALKLITDAVIDTKMSKKDTKNSIKQAISLIAGETGAVETIRFKNADKKIFTSNLADLIRDQIDLGRKFSNKTVQNNLDKFAAAAKKMVNTKSMMGLAVVLPLAMSVQYINRAITRHKYQKTGAPIYKDFEKEERVLTPEEQKRLNRNKPICASLMVGLAMLSMMKRPSLEMFQFKGMFPTVDQCRWIATATFASRMLAAEDPNELRESTVRDIASFSGLYFLGDYASKAAATFIQKKTGTKLLNYVKETPKDASALKKFGNWVKNVKVKSFDEVLKNAKATKYRGVCELASLGFSILTLGFLLPMYNKRVTARKDAERKANMQKEQDKIQKMTSPNGAASNITPQNMLIHPMKDTTISKDEAVSILNGTKVKDLQVTEFNVQKSSLDKGYYDFEMKGKFKDWEDYTKDRIYQKVATECFK